MICPVLSKYIELETNRSIELFRVDCIKAECQWWVTDLGTNLYGNCAIHQIAKAQQMNHDTPV